MREEHGKKAAEVRIFVDQNSSQIVDELEPGAQGAERNKVLAKYRHRVQVEDVKEVEKLCDGVKAAVGKLSSDEAAVPARKRGWTDTDIHVEPGDIVQLRVREGDRWWMAEHLPPAGPSGWDGNEDKRIDGGETARAGSLVLRIGYAGTGRIHKAYLGSPITADARGRVLLRMNEDDKLTDDNRGELHVEVVSANPGSLRGVTDLWQSATAEQ
jgi:hypothetical protein